MATVVPTVTRVENNWTQSNLNKSFVELIRLAQASSTEGLNAAARVSGKPDFVAFATAAIVDSTTDIVSGEVIDLVDQGVVFAAGSVTEIELKCFMADDDNIYFEHTRQYIYSTDLGAEAVLGCQKLIDGAAVLDYDGTPANQSFGLTLDFGTTADGAATTDSTDADSPAGTTLGALTSSSGTLAMPAVRKVVPIHVTENHTTYDATKGRIGNVDVALGSGTNIPGGTAKFASPDDGAADTAGPAGTFTCALMLYPPAHAEVAITGGQPSINVTLPDLSLGDRTSKWRVEVYIKSQRFPFTQ